MILADFGDSVLTLTFVDVLVIVALIIVVTVVLRRL